MIANSVEQPPSGPDGKTLVAANGGGGFVGVAGLVSIVNLSDVTEAFIASTNVNSAADFGGVVLVRAHADTILDVVSGNVSGGLVAVGGNYTRTSITSTTRAFISDNDETGSFGQRRRSQVYARDVEVSTVSRETIDATVFGITGGLVAVAGTVSVIDVAAHNEAFIRDSNVLALGNLSVLADDTATIDTDVGTIAGAGAAISVNTIGNVSRAQVQGGTLNATGTITVAADSDEFLDALTGTVGAGVGLAGAVVVNTIETTTEALIQTGTTTSQINQDPRFQSGGQFVPGSGQRVFDVATDAVGWPEAAVAWLGPALGRAEET